METTTEDWKDDNSQLAPLLNNDEQVSKVGTFELTSARVICSVQIQKFCSALECKIAELIAI